LLASDFGTAEDLRRIEQQAGVLDEQFNRIALDLGTRECAKSA
jgi:hypothetical protein